MLLTDLLIEYKDALFAGKLSDHTARNYVSRARQFVNWFETVKPGATAPDLSPARVRQFMGWLKSRNFGSASNSFVSLKQFCVWLVKQGHLKENPCETVDAPVKPEGRRTPITQAELAALYEGIDRLPRSEFRKATARAILTLLSAAGLRVGEAKRLTVEDFDAEGRALRLWQTKGNKSRVVFLNNAAYDVLRDYISLRAAKVAQSKCPAPAQLLLHDGRVGMTEDGIRTYLHLLATVSGLETAKITPHRLRHTFATMHMRAGTPIAVISNMLGHSNQHNTEIYLHADSEMQKAYIHNAPAAPPAPEPTPKPAAPQTAKKAKVSTIVDRSRRKAADAGPVRSVRQDLRKPPIAPKSPVRQGRRRAA